MAAPWTVADFKQEIVSAGLLLQARPHLPDSGDLGSTVPFRSPFSINGEEWMAVALHQE